MKKRKALLCLSALAQDSRLAIFRLLMDTGETGLSAGAISEALGVPATTLSFHLSQLSTASLIKFRKEGRSVIYYPNYKKVKQLTQFLKARPRDEVDSDVVDITENEEETADKKPLVV